MAPFPPTRTAASPGRTIPSLAARLRLRILVFAKAPVAGRVKTRLIPLLGAAGAAHLAARMLGDTLVESTAAAVATVELCTDPYPENAVWDFVRDLPDSLAPQGRGDLGERLARAASRGVEAGEAVLLIGTDCPQLDRHRLRRAAELLEGHDAFIHPAADGGYALLGLQRFDPSVFAGMAWSTGSVAAETIARIRRLNWSLHVGDTLHDVDEPADLERIGHKP
ncbi:MAG: TIGR04282 family arsenosugar biosynthesis glycosyltransferase [Allosphingosinicella sp.]